MILCNKDEVDYLRNKCKDVSVTRTCKQKSKRHRYYVTETPKVRYLLSVEFGRVFSTNGGAEIIF